MTSMLAKYEAACRAVAEVSKAKEIRDKAVAMAVYARQAKNKELEIDAELIRSQAERRLGQLIERQWATEGKASGRPKIPSEEVVISPKAKLADAGIDWKLSSRAQAVAKIPDAEFEQIVAARKPKAINHAVKNLARKATHSKIRAEAEKRNRPDAFAPFALIYADPPWEFETYSVKGKDGAAPDNHYPTMTVP